MRHPQNALLSPLFIATIEGVTREPSALGITTGSPPSMTATQELVVPRSIPITFGTIASYYFDLVVVCVGTPYATLRIRILQPAVHSLPAPYSALRQWRVHTACALGQSHPVVHRFCPPGRNAPLPG